MFWNENSQHKNVDSFTQYIPASPLGYLREWSLEAAGKVCELLGDLLRNGGSAHVRAFAHRIIMLPIHCRSMAHLSLLSL